MDSAQVEIEIGRRRRVVHRYRVDGEVAGLGVGRRQPADDRRRRQRADRQRRLLVAQYGNVAPVVVAHDGLDDRADCRPRPGRSDQRPVDRVGVERRVATQFRHERPVPVGSQIADRSTDCDMAQQG